MSTDTNLEPLTPFAFDLGELAVALGVDYDDILFVAAAELDDWQYDDASYTVTQAGKDFLIQHFTGGSDPE